MRAIDEGAEDIEMAAAEGVFDKSTFSSAPPSRWPVAPDRERLERSATLGRSSAYPEGLNDPNASEGGVAHTHFATDFAFRELERALSAEILQAPAVRATGTALAPH